MPNSTTSVPDVPAALRWARASRHRGDFCHDAAHASSDYRFREPKLPPAPGETPRLVDKIGCHRCWPRERNPTALGDAVALGRGKR